MGDGAEQDTGFPGVHFHVSASAHETPPLAPSIPGGGDLRVGRDRGGM
jgi:hypothetical protein